MLLADMGAEVVTVDRTAPSGLGIKKEARFNPTTRSRASMAADLKSESGRAVVLRLIERADALIEGYRPGVMERLGLGPEVCWARNPKLVYGRATGWGQDGPLAESVGHDLNYLP
jgi:alpha-methylacyl-CoA racemase